MEIMKKPFVRPVLREEASLDEATLFFLVQNAELLTGRVCPPDHICMIIQ